MADMWDIARYIEDHPDNHDQRWRLAKKLYMAWEYRLALEHLQILKREWPDKVNVVRYLGATYYRLGRYEESITELRRAIAVWPSEVGLREQLARVLEVAGRREEAADEWEGLLKLQSDHPIAERAAQRLRAQPTESPKEKLNLADSDSGIDLSPGRVCPNCGAQNSDEFERCWQCHAPLRSVRTPTPRPISLPGAEGTPSAVLGVLGVVATVLLFGISTYFTVSDLLLAHAVSQGQNVYHNLSEFLHVEFAVPRAIIGAALLVLWPLALLLGLRMAKEEEIIGKQVLLMGLFLTTLTYALAWLPGYWFAVAPIAGLGASLALVFSIFRGSVVKRAKIWVVQGVVVLVAGLGIFIILEDFRPFTEAGAITRYANTIEASGGSYSIPSPEGGLHIPVDVRVKWASTGSVWLDNEANTILIQIDTEPTTPMPTFEFKNDQETVYFGDLEAGMMTKTFKVTPNTPYEIIINGPDGHPVSVVIRGVLRPLFEKS